MPMLKGHVVNGAIPGRVLDVLETEDMWMTVSELHAQFVDRFDTGNVVAIDRAVQRLAVNNRIKTRLVDAHSLNTSSDFHWQQLEVRFR